MTKEENIEFFNKVRCKKIRWSNWLPTSYFIPVRLIGLETGVMIGDIYMCASPKITNGFICEGFEKNAEGAYWELYEEEIALSSKGKPECTCNINDLMNYGCRCGCIQKERTNG